MYAVSCFNKCSTLFSTSKVSTILNSDGNFGWQVMFHFCIECTLCWTVTIASVNVGAKMAFALKINCMFGWVQSMQCHTMNKWSELETRKCICQPKPIKEEMELFLRMSEKHDIRWFDPQRWRISPQCRLYKLTGSKSIVSSIIKLTICKAS